MKKLAIIITVIAVLAGCQKTTPEPTPQDVNVTITYTLDTSVGSDMTKATDAEVFDMFYQKMKTGEMVEPSYKLIFTETNTGAQYVFNGEWGENDIITIRTGNYRVTGTSTAEGECMQEIASLKFEQEIEISTSSTSITLNAIYDCFLLAFAKSDIVELANKHHNNYTPTPFFTFGDYYYAFISDKIWSYVMETGKDNVYIIGTREDGSTFKILTYNAAFEKGKYYIYNDVSGSFELPKMEAGI